MKAEDYCQQGKALYDLGKYDEAIEKYKKAVELDPKYAKAYNNWGIALGNLGKYDEAIEQFTKAVELEPKNASAYYNWGVTLDSLGKYDEAIEKYKKAVGIDPNFAHAYNNWGSALGNLGEYKKAIEKLKKAVGIDPTDASAYNNWGNALDKLGNHEEAIEKYKKAIELDPNFALYSSNLTNAQNKANRAEVEKEISDREQKLEKRLKDKYEQQDKLRQIEDLGAGYCATKDRYLMSANLFLIATIVIPLIMLAVYIIVEYSQVNNINIDRIIFSISLTAAFVTFVCYQKSLSMRRQEYRMEHRELVSHNILRLLRELDDKDEKSKEFIFDTYRQLYSDPFEKNSANHLDKHLLEQAFDLANKVIGKKDVTKKSKAD